VTRQRISSGSTFETEMAYSRAVVDGDFVFVAGTTGFDYASKTLAEDMAAQTEQCFKNIESALTQAGASLADVVRVTYVLPSFAELELAKPIMRKYLGDVRPAAMMISAGLIDSRMKIEIEVTARKNS
jgi:enamine deaminase RidA (YjgF/YER057c/UK114 family)